MLELEIAIRHGTVAIMLLDAIVALRDRRRSVSGPFGGLLALSAATYVMVSTPYFHPVPWLWPFQVISMGTPPVFWIWTRAAFDDDFRPSWRDAALWAVLPAIRAFDLYRLGPWVGWFGEALALLFVLLAAWRILVGLREDLVEPRRRLRLILVAVALVYTAGVIVNGALSSGQPPSAAAGLASAIVMLALGLAFALLGLTTRQPFPARPAALPNEASPEAAEIRSPEPPIDEQEAALLARLRRLMDEDKVYRQEGLSIVSLAVRLELPEYRLRRLINQRLGHRNFTSFVNGYRLAETASALSDRSQAEVPVLTIALDAGFQSIGPFNRAFKEHTGMTPTAYRKQAISGIGQPV